MMLIFNHKKKDDSLKSVIAQQRCLQQKRKIKHDLSMLAFSIEQEQMLDELRKKNWQIHHQRAHYEEHWHAYIRHR